MLSGTRFGDQTLRERDRLAAHFACSHTQFWSAVRYGFIPTAAKPVVDDAPLSWCETGGWGALDLFAESQRPWTADLWKKRREVFWGKVATESADFLGNSLNPLQVSEKMVSAGLAKKQRRFSKLDLTAIILDRGLSESDLQSSTSGKGAGPRNRGDASLCAHQPEETQGVLG